MNRKSGKANRLFVQTERIRGEGSWLYIEGMTRTEKEIANSLGINDYHG